MGDIRGNLEKAKGGKPATQAVPLPAVPRFEAMINREWRRVLCINYHTGEPTISFDSTPKEGHWLMNGVKYPFTTTGYQSGWPLKGTKLRLSQRLPQTGAKSE